MKTLSKSLGIDMAGLAQLIKSKGRGRDTVLAHITPKEAALLKSRGGRGSINPDTGLPEYDDEGSTDFGGGSGISYSPQTFDYGAFNSTLSSAPDQGTGLQLPQATVSDQGQISYDQPLGIDTAPTDAAQSLPTPGITTGTPEDVSQFQQTEQQVAQDLSGYGGGGAPATTDTTGKDSGGTSWLKDLLSAAGGAAGLLKLAGTAGVGALGANYAQQAAQQGQAAANQIGAMAQPVQQRAAAAQQQLGNIAGQAQNYGQQAVNAIGQVIPQLQQVGQNITALGQPLTQQGTELMSQAQSGALTPANQAALDALRAQAQQNISRRGGVGAMQAGVAEQNARAQLAQQQLQQGQGLYQAGAAYALQGQSMAAQAAQLGLNQAQVQLAQNNLANQIQSSAITLGLQQAGIADQYTQQAIMVGLQSDQALATNMQNFYKSLAQVAFSTPMSQYGQTATRTTA
jgi:hypothetical protein